MIAPAVSVAVLLVGGSVADPAALAVPPAVLARAEALVGRLGDRQFLDRDAATRELASLGRLALAVVRAGQRSPDPEVRRRCDRLAPAMEAEELAARLSVFVADVDGRFDHVLPGWDVFRAAAGTDAAARRLFSAIVQDRSNWPLLTAIRGPGVEVRPALLGAAGGLGAWADRPHPPRVAKAAAVRRWEFWASQNGPEPVDDDAPPARRPDIGVPELALVMLAETLHSERLTTRRGYEIDVNSLLNRPAGRGALLGGGPFGPAFARLARVWLDTRDGPGAMVALTMAGHMRLDPAAVRRYAARVVGRRDIMAETRAECLGRIVDGKAAEYLGVILGQFDDPTPLGAGLLKDHMLLAAVRLTGQAPADYGLTDGGPAGPFGGRVGAAVAAQREVAFARWRAWEVGRFGAAAGFGAVRP